MNFYHIDNLYIGVLVTINNPTRKRPHITKDVSKKIIFERIIKDDNIFYASVLTGTFVPAEYSTKTLIKGMTYCANVEPLSNYYNKTEVIDKESVKIIESEINKEISSKIDTSKIYKTDNIYIGRIFHFTVDNYIRIYSTQIFSREYIFEQVDYKNYKAYREIWSKIVYCELQNTPKIGKEYIQIIPFNEVFKGYKTVTENELLNLEQRLSNSVITKPKKALTLKSQFIR